MSALNETAPRRPEAIAGLIGLALNVVAVGLLDGVPHPYRPDDLAGWHAGTTQLAGASVASAACFTVGLVLLVPWARAWGRGAVGFTSSPSNRLQPALPIK